MTTTAAPPASAVSDEPVTCAAKPSTGAGLHDVERLAFGDAPFLVDQADVPRDGAPRQRVREQAAEFAGAENDNPIHLRALL